MPRSARQAPGGMVFHVLNRGVGRMRLFEKDEDYAAFEAVLVGGSSSRLGQAGQPGRNDGGTGGVAAVRGPGPAFWRI